MPSLSMYCSRVAVPGPSAMAPVRLFLALAASGVSFTRSITSGTNVCACTSTTVTRRPPIIARRLRTGAPGPVASRSAAKWHTTTAPAAAPATVLTKSRRFISSSLSGLEVHLHAQPYQTATENLRHVLPDAGRRAVGRVHVEDVAGIQDVVDVHVPPHLARTELEDSGEAQVHLLEPRLEQPVLRDQANRQVGTTCRGAAARAQVASERRQDLRVGRDVAGGDRNTRTVLVDRAGLDVPRQRVHRHELHLRRLRPGGCDVAEFRQPGDR